MFMERLALSRSFPPARALLVCGKHHAIQNLWKQQAADVDPSQVRCSVVNGGGTLPRQPDRCRRWWGGNRGRADGQGVVFDFRGEGRGGGSEIAPATGLGINAFEAIPWV